MKQTILFMLLIMVAISCGEDEPDDNPNASIQFNFAFEVDGEALDYGQAYLINDDVVSFDVAQYYIGELSLTMDNGSTLNFDDQYLLAVPNTSARADAGENVGKTITKVDFNVGVSPEENSQSEMDFTEREETDVLAAQDPSMHWNWNTGYKFLRVDGDVDTDGDGVVDTGIAYHIGSDALLQALSVDSNIKIDQGDNSITFVLDLADFFANVDLSSEIDTHTGNVPELAQRLVNNYSTSISIE